MDYSNLLEGEKITAFYKEHIDAYTIVTIEDSFYQYDWYKWTKFTVEVGDKVNIVYGNLTVTNLEKICPTVEKGSSNCLLVKFY